MSTADGPAPRSTPAAPLVLVTGGSGFIGRAVVEALHGAGLRVRVLDLVAPASAPEGVEVEVGDVREPAVDDRALAGVDVVVHHAAKVGIEVGLQDLPAYTSSNDLGTAELLAAMARAQVRRFVLASSMVVYGEGAYRCTEHGETAAPPRREADLAAGVFDPRCPRCGRQLEAGLVGEDAVLDPRSAYAASKVAQEHLATAWVRGGGGRAVALRYHNVYGPGLPRNTPYAGVAAIFRSALLAGRAPEVFEDGGQRRDFVHVRDVATANLAAVRSLLADQPADDGGGRGQSALRAYNVASGTVRTVGDLAAQMARALDGPAPVVTGRYRGADVRHVTADSSRLREELGWEPAVGFADGVAEVAREGSPEPVA